MLQSRPREEVRADRREAELREERRGRIVLRMMAGEERFPLQLAERVRDHAARALGGESAAPERREEVEADLQRARLVLDGLEAAASGELAALAQEEGP